MPYRPMNSASGKNRLLIKESNYAPTPKVRPEFLGSCSLQNESQAPVCTLIKQSCERKLCESIVCKENSGLAEHLFKVFYKIKIYYSETATCQYKRTG